MKKFFISFSLIFLLCATINARLFLIERGSTSFTYTDIKSAVDALQDGDKLYIPPGVFNVSEHAWSGYNNDQNHTGVLAINKRVSIVGAGYLGSSTSAVTGGILLLSENASMSSITGLLIEKLTLDNVSNLILSRCKITGATALSGSGGGNVLKECDFNTIAQQSSSVYKANGAVLQISASKCIFRSPNNSGFNLKSSTISNCILLSDITYGNSIESSTFSNTIFIISKTGITTSPHLGSTSNSIYNNNLWVGSSGNSSYLGTNNTFNSGNIHQVIYTETFIDAAGGDYRLQESSSGKNAGTDGTDIGIYGTAFPFKENRLPSSPAFVEKDIHTETDASGNLPVRIVIEAQTN